MTDEGAATINASYVSNFKKVTAPSPEKLVIEVSVTQPPGVATPWVDGLLKVPSPAVYLAPVELSDTELLAQSIALALIEQGLTQAREHHAIGRHWQPLLDGLRLRAQHHAQRGLPEVDRPPEITRDGMAEAQPIWLSAADDCTGTAAPPELRAASLLLQGEAAYHAGDHGVAAAAFRRALVEFPGGPQAGLTRLAAAWTSLRLGRRDEARREFLDFARSAPNDPHAVDALVLAAELSIAGGDLDTARRLLDQTIQAHPTHPRTDFARLNRDEMMDRVMTELSRSVYGDSAHVVELEVQRINCHHNFTQLEEHFGERVWVTRKGAIEARRGMWAMIPGSMGTRSYIVTGLENPMAFNSAPHGAGRRYSRTQARKLFTMADLERAIGASAECRTELVGAPPEYAPHYERAARRYRLGARGPGPGGRGHRGGASAGSLGYPLRRGQQPRIPARGLRERMDAPRPGPGAAAVPADPALPAPAAAAAGGGGQEGKVSDLWDGWSPSLARCYVAHRVGAPFEIDGRLDKAPWRDVPWTEDFVDIEGDAKPGPRFRTRAKMCWDDACIYVAAEMEEPHVWGTLTKHDSVIFHDNDFEVGIGEPLQTLEGIANGARPVALADDHRNFRPPHRPSERHFRERGADGLGMAVGGSQDGFADAADESTRSECDVDQSWSRSCRAASPAGQPSGPLTSGHQHRSDPRADARLGQRAGLQVDPTQRVQRLGREDPAAGLTRRAEAPLAQLPRLIRLAVVVADHGEAPERLSQYRRLPCRLARPASADASGAL